MRPHSAFYSKVAIWCEAVHFFCGLLLFNNELYNQKMSNALAKIATFAIYIDP